jgi:hypothetical protein
MIAVLAALVGTGTAAFKLYPERAVCPPCPPPQSWWGFGFAMMAFVVAAVAGAFKIEQSRTKDKEDAQIKGPAALIGCLHTLHGAVLGAKGLTDNGVSHLRITVHKVISNTEIVQIVPYVGGPGGGIGRKLGHCGVVGLSILKGKPQGMARVGRTPKSHVADYLEELTSKWFVPAEVATQMRTDRMAFLAVPLKDAKEKVVGAVFLDAKRADFFDDATVICVVNSCAGIVKFLKEYSGSRT